MSENKTRKWPVNANRNKHLNVEEAERAKQLFDQHDDSIDEQCSGLSEDDATLYVVWITGFHPDEARWIVRKSRGEKVGPHYGDTIDLSTLTDAELREWAGSDEEYQRLKISIEDSKAEN